MDLSINVDVYRENGTLTLADKQGKVVSFSKDQIVQQKVSMVTLGELSSLSRTKIAKAFGFATRKSYYDARDAVLNGRAEELIPKRTGPKKARKRTHELEVLVIRMRCDTDKSMYEIADALKYMGFDVSARLVGNILSDYGLSKKKRPKR